MNWNHKKLVEICNPRQWKTISFSELMPSGYPVYGANGKVGFFNKYTHTKSTVLITCRGATCGEINICEPMSYVNGNAMALDNLAENVDINFLSHYLKYRGFKDTISGSAQPQITRQGLRKVTVPLPSFPEQQRIAAILDHADSIRRKNRLILEKYNELAQSVFSEMFGDPFTNSNNTGLKIKDVSEKITYGFTRPMPHIEDGIPIITAKNVLFGEIDFKNVDYTDKESFDNLTKKSKPKRNDLLVVKDGVSLGRPALVETDSIFCISQAVTLLIPKKELINPKFLLRYLLSQPVQNRIKGMAKGNAMPHLQITEFANFPLPSVDYSKQDHFVSIIDKITEQIELSKQSLEKSEDLFQSLLQRVFKGEL